MESAQTTPSEVDQRYTAVVMFLNVPRLDTARALIDEAANLLLHPESIALCDAVFDSEQENGAGSDVLAHIRERQKILHECQLYNPNDGIPIEDHLDLVFRQHRVKPSQYEAERRIAWKFLGVLNEIDSALQSDTAQIRIHLERLGYSWVQIRQAINWCERLAQTDILAATMMLKYLLVGWIALTLYADPVDVLRWTENGLALARQYNEPMYVAVYLSLCSHALLRLGRSADALKYVHERLKIAEDARDVVGLAEAHDMLANAYVLQGTLKEAQLHAEKALAGFLLLSDDYESAAVTMGTLAGIHVRLGNDDTAKTYFEQSIARFKKQGKRIYLARILSNYAGLLTKQGRYEVAAQMLEEAVQLAEAYDDRETQALIHVNRSVLETQRRDLDAAMEGFLSADALGSEKHLPSISALSQTNIALLNVEMGQPETALQTLDTALALLRSTGDQLTLCMALAWKAAAHISLHQQVEAEVTFQEARYWVRKLQGGFDECELLVQIAKAYSKADQRDRARTLLEEAVLLLDETPKTDLKFEVLQMLGELCVQSGEYAQALAYYSRGLNLAQAGNNGRRKQNFLMARGTVLGYMKRYDESIRLLRESLAIADAATERDREMTHYNLGYTLSLARRHQEALLEYEAAGILARNQQNRSAEASYIASRAMVERSMGRLEDSLTHFHQALEIFISIDDEASADRVRAEITTIVR